MDDIPCDDRLEGRKNGKVVFHLCNHPAAGQYKQRVKRPICEACPLRLEEEEPQFKAEILADGTIVYEKRAGDWEPPREHKGYRRKSTDSKSPDAWVFIPEWPSCPNRQLNTQRKTGCGCLLVEMTCLDNRSPFNGKPVELENCVNCPLIHN